MFLFSANMTSFDFVFCKKRKKKLLKYIVVKKFVF